MEIKALNSNVELELIFPVIKELRTQISFQDFIRLYQSHAQVARIVKDKYPEESLKIWRSLAEHHIAQTNPSAYVTAVGYLKEAQKIYTKTKRTKEWSQYIDHLREENKRKPRFIKELRRLSGEKLL